MKIGSGTIVNVTTLAGPSSAKDEKRVVGAGKWKAGSEKHFGMKAHGGVDAGTQLIHSVATGASG